jgi:hypothetical protein
VVMNNGVHRHVVVFLHSRIDRGMAHRFQCLPSGSCIGLKHVVLHIMLDCQITWEECDEFCRVLPA